MEPLKAGDRFGDFTVERLLGKGGMGLVYLVRSPEGTRYAVKVMYPDKTTHDLRKRFAREAEIAMGIHHKNLIPVYDVGEDPDTGLCYILMDYISGGSLSSMLAKRGPLPVSEAVLIAVQIASGLDAAHKRGIVHRDLKPDNILFDDAGRPRIADLGVAKLTNGEQQSMVTMTGMVIGTPAYMSPEQLMDSHKIDARADIYSLGLILYEMLTGKRPNAGSTAVELLAKALKGEPVPDIRTIRPELSAAISYVVSLLCAPNPDDRPKTALASAALLRKAASGKLVLPKKRPNVVAIEKVGKMVLDNKLTGRQKIVVAMLVLTGVVALLALAAIGLWFMVSGDDTSHPESPPTAETKNVADASAQEKDRAEHVEREQIVITNVIEKTSVVTNVIERVEVVTNTVNVAEQPIQDEASPVTNVAPSSLDEQSVEDGKKKEGKDTEVATEPSEPEKKESGEDVTSPVDKKVPEETSTEKSDTEEDQNQEQTSSAFDWRTVFRLDMSKAMRTQNAGELREIKNDISNIVFVLNKEMGGALFDDLRNRRFRIVFYDSWHKDYGNPNRKMLIRLKVTNDTRFFATHVQRHAFLVAFMENLINEMYMSNVSEYGSSSVSSIDSYYYSYARSPETVVFDCLLEYVYRKLFARQPPSDDGKKRLMLWALECDPTMNHYNLAGQPVLKGGSKSQRIRDQRWPYAKMRWMVDELLRQHGEILPKYFRARHDEIAAGRIKPPVKIGDMVALFSIAARGNLFNWFADHGVNVSINNTSVNMGKLDDSAQAVVPIRQVTIFPRVDPESSKWKSRSPWRYSVKDPQNLKWYEPSFNDRKWRKTYKAFGYGKQDAKLMSIADRWRTNDLWLRRYFSWSGKSVTKVIFHVSYGNTADIYLNGKYIRHLSNPGTDNIGWQPVYVPVDLFMSAVRNGDNVLAIKVQDEGQGGARYFDCGLTVEVIHGGEDVPQKSRSK